MEHVHCSYYEVETSKLVADALKSMGYEVHAGWAKTGVVGILRCG
jgi:hippurate hydrolase